MAVPPVACPMRRLLPAASTSAQGRRASAGVRKAGADCSGCAAGEDMAEEDGAPASEGLSPDTESGLQIMTCQGCNNNTREPACKPGSVMRHAA